MSITALIKRLHEYQSERFPLAAILISLIPAVFSTAALGGGGDVRLYAAALISSVAYLFHIRVIDERRDFAHDALHHRDRPVQSGRITKTELRRLDIISVAAMLALSAVFGLLPFAAALVLLSYSFLCAHEFFVGERIRRRFFAYNALNLVQMLLLQVFMYVLFGVSSVVGVIVLHFIFTAFGSALLEVVRKIKTPGHDGTGRDTYSHHLGFGGSLALFTGMVALQCVAFAGLAWEIGASTSALLLGLLFAILAGLSALSYYRRQSSGAEKTLQVALLVSYAIQNLIIFYAA